MNNFKNDSFFLLLSVIVALLVLSIDISIPLGVAGGVLYILTILLISNHSNYKYIWHAAIITSLLVGIGYNLSPVGGEFWKVLVNRFLAIFAIWVTAILIVKIKKVELKRLQVQKNIARSHKKTSEERAVLLQEIHHRVKNNLQLTSSLLGIQSIYVNDDKLKVALKSSQDRISSMALIHEMLYQTEDFSKINYGEYLNKLVMELVSAMQTPENPVKLKLDVPDLYLSTKTAIPLGLLVNEITTNSLKHGQKEGESFEIELYIKQNSENDYTLYIGDNGKGNNKGDELKKTKSLGYTLMNTFVSQLEGSIENDYNKPGTNYIVSFKKKETLRRKKGF